MLSPRHGNFVLVPLHSSLTSEEQAAVFRYVLAPLPNHFIFTLCIHQFHPSINKISGSPRAVQEKLSFLPILLKHQLQLMTVCLLLMLEE